MTELLVNKKQLAVMCMPTFLALENVDTKDNDGLPCQTCRKRFSHPTNLCLHDLRSAIEQIYLVLHGISYASKRTDQHEI